MAWWHGVSGDSTARSTDPHLPHGARSAKPLLFVCSAVLAVASVVAFSRVLHWYFIDVDTLSLISTGRLHGFGPLGAILSSRLMFDLMPNARFFRPLASVSWGLDELFWGLDPLGYHLSDLLLHSLNGQLLFVVMRASWLQLAASEPEVARPATRDRALATRVAFVAALLFTINPAQAEFVPVIARRADLLATSFLLASWMATLAYARKPGAGRLAWVVIATACALLSKEVAVLVPVSVVALLLVCSRQSNIPALIRELVVRSAPIALITACFLIWRGAVLHGLGGYAPEPHSVWREFLGSGAVSLLLLLAPGQLNRVSAALAPWALELGSGALVVLLSVVAWSVAQFLKARRARLVLWLAGSGLALQSMPLWTGRLLPRQSYLHSIFFAILLAWLSVGPAHVVAPGSARWVRYSAGARSFLRALAVVCIGYLLSASPVLGHSETLNRWRDVGEVSRFALEGAASQLASAQPGTTVFLVNFPYQLRTDDDPRGLPQPEATVLLDHSVQGFLDLRFPNHHFDVMGLTYLTLPSADWQRFRACVRFEARERRLEVRVLEGSASVSPFPWPDVYGRHDRRLTPSIVERWPDGRPTGRAMLLKLYAQYRPDTALFLVYTAEGVQLRRFEDFGVESCS